MSGRKICIGSVLVTAMVAALIYVSHGVLNAGKKETYRTVAVILNDSSHDRWNAFKEGLEQAAEKYHIRLNIAFTGNFQSQEEECAAIQRELESGAEGVIVQVAAEESMELFDRTVGETPVVLVQNDTGSEKHYTAVAADQQKLGAALAESLLAGQKDSLEGIQIGVLSGDQRMHSQKVCLESFLSALQDSKAQIAWTLSEEEWNAAAGAKSGVRLSEADVVAALDNRATECAVTFLQENRDVSWKIYGEGRSEEAVYYLDKGDIEALVVPNGFYMGYRSVEAMAQKLKHQASEEEKNEVDFLTVTRETMYQKEAEKVLFPIVS